MKKKHKFLKPFSFASLALLMGIAGTMAFAPLGASSPSLASANEMVDQVNTKADGENIKYAPSALGLDPKNDPVIYTTESGLEIKYGGIDLNNSLASGKPLSGYPYFTMGTYNGYAVNWVIIGRNTNVTALYTEIESYLFSVWKANELNTFGQYFFNSQYENLTPAGTSINQDVQTKAYVTDNETISLTKKNIVTNDEIPSGCVLVISECNLGTSVFNATVSNTTNLSAYRKGCRYRYQSDNSSGTTWTNKTNGYLYNAVTNLYTSGLGLTNAEKALIQPQKLTTRYSASTTFSGATEVQNLTGGTSIIDTYDTDGNTLYHLFPLAAGWNGASENFVHSTYLTTNALKVAYAIGTTTAQAWWTRTGWYISDASAVNTDGSNYWGPSVGASAVYGVRPACIIAV